MSRLAIVLLSGGLDSAVTLAFAMSKGYKPVAVSFDYDQRHRIELERAKSLVRYYGVENHVVFKLDFHAIGNSALTDNSIDVPEDRTLDEKDIPVTYVPGRNTIFLSYAMALGDAMNIHTVFIGANAVDYSGYPDCRSEYMNAMEKVFKLGTKSGVSGENWNLYAPLIDAKKALIVQTGFDLDVPFGYTSSCYNPDEDGTACGVCDSCKIRLAAFKEIGKVDPIKYR